MIRVGCSGWNYASWRGGEFYPPRCPPSRWLSHYAGVFDTVEVNSTFYRLAKRHAVERWVTQVPDDFCFAVKASQYLTHVRRLADMDRGLRRLMEPLEPLVESGKLGPMLWQLPPTFRRDDARLRFALEHLPPGRHAFEFRHASWFHDDVYDLLREHEVALTIAHRKGHDFPHELTAGWTFVRFHYGERGRRGNYSDSELAEWAQRIHGWGRRGDVYAYFNNDWEVFAPRNARVLLRGLRRQAAPAAATAR